MELTRTRLKLQEDLKTTADINTIKAVSTTIHNTNRELYETLTNQKDSKFDQINWRPKLKTSPGKKEVVCIPETLPLTDDERKVLANGLTFVPTQKHNIFKTTVEVQQFIRKIRLRAHFSDEDGDAHAQTNTEPSVFEKYNKKKKNWTPPSGDYDAVDKFADDCLRDAKILAEKHTTPKPNIPRNQQRAIQNLRKREDIYINKADKGGAICVWDKQLYFNEGHKQLSDTKFYSKVNEDKSKEHQNLVKGKISQLINENRLPDNAINLIVKNPKAGNFYLLPKIHKEGIPGRPISSNINCPTYHVSQFLSEVMRPMVERLDTHIKDTNHVVNIIQDFNFNDSGKPLLFTMDIKSLYTNIPNHQGLKALKHFLNKFNVTSYDHTAILRLTELVLTINCFTFDGEFYSQISGLMMGTPCGGDFANLFCGWEEELIKESYTGEQPELLKRYIDDNFGATTMPREQLEAYCEYVNNHNPHIKYTFSISDESIPMLDTKLSIKDNKIVSSIYYKETDGHTYLKYNSEHPSSLKNSIPYSQFLRLRRISNTNQEFKESAKEMADFFSARDYPKQTIQDGLKRALSKTRQEALSKPVKNNEDKLTFAITYNSLNTKVVSAILKNYTNLQQDPIIGKTFTVQPTIAYRRGPTIGKAVTNTKIKQQHEVLELKGTFPCERTRCVTCAHTNNDPTIIGPTGYVEAQEKFICTSQEVVYAITCQVCGQIYIGETGRALCERFRQHRREVINELDKPSNNNKFKPVTQHFTSNGHTEHDMLVGAICHVSSKKDRFTREQQIIAQVGAYRGEAMNIDFRYLDLQAGNL